MAQMTPSRHNRRFAPRRALALLAAAVAALAVWSAPASAATGHRPPATICSDCLAEQRLEPPAFPRRPNRPALARDDRRAAPGGATRADGRDRTVDPDGQLQHAALHRRGETCRPFGWRSTIPTRRGASGLQKAYNRVPISPNARPAAGSDGHMTVWQPSTDKLWEFWQARKRERHLARRAGAGR